MLDLKKLEAAPQMAKKVLEKYDYDIKKCKEYIMIKYLEAEDNPNLNQYWLDVGRDVEKQFSIKETTF